VDGVSATAETAESGDYSLSRPLFIYTTADIMENNQAVSVFVNYYLTHVNEEINDVGYFPASSERIMTAQQAWVEANPGLGLQPGQWASINPNGLEGAVQIAGSSTVFPLTQRLAERFQSAGFGGTIAEESIGSTAGFQRFCVAGDIDIANASRPITTGEYSACRANNRRPIEIRVGTDALAVIVSNENSFLTDVTQEELKQIFTTAVTWSDVNPAWPDEPIYRYIPGADPQSRCGHLFADLRRPHPTRSALPRRRVAPRDVASTRSRCHVADSGRRPDHRRPRLAHRSRDGCMAWPARIRP
jgi:phosphate transport system substrate-binding protein